ncbi:MAG: sugar transporter [Pseudomonadota bacterium]
MPQVSETLKVAPTAQLLTEQKIPDLRPRLRIRHVFSMILLLILGLLPGAAAWWYSFQISEDQFHSVTAFSVRHEESASPIDVFGAFGGGTTLTAQDSEVLLSFIRSQAMVELIDSEFDLEAIFRTGSNDLVFTLWPDASIERKLRYWRRMVSVYADPNTHLVEVEVRAFDPDDARAILRAVVEHSTLLLNDLNQSIQNTAVSFALEDVAVAEERLSAVRLELRSFRLENQFIDPNADVTAQSGVLAVLQERLADALVRRNSIMEYATEGDVRLEAVEREIRSVRTLIDEERISVADETTDTVALPEVVGAFEELLVDLEFSESAYTAALASLELARAEARRTTRHLSVHVPPTLSEESIYPRRYVITAVAVLAGMMLWIMTVLMSYSARDRA